MFYLFRTPGARARAGRGKSRAREQYGMAANVQPLSQPTAHTTTAPSLWARHCCRIAPARKASADRATFENPFALARPLVLRRAAQLAAPPSRVPSWHWTHASFLPFECINSDRTNFRLLVASWFCRCDLNSTDKASPEFFEHLGSTSRLPSLAGQMSIASSSSLRCDRYEIATIADFKGWDRSHESRYKFRFDTKVVLEIYSHSILYRIPQ